MVTSAVNPSTVSLRTGGRRSIAVGLMLAGSLLAAGWGQGPLAAQALRVCVDRWNQGNMVGWAPAPANVAFRRPLAKERSNMELSPSRQCIVAIAAGGGTWTC